MSALSVTIKKAARTLAPRKALVVMTPTAVNKLKTFQEDKPDHLGLRIDMKSKGCNGFAFVLDYAKQKEKMDLEVDQDGVKLLIAPKALMSIIGTEMDFVEGRLNSGFVFKNPNVKETCGCGESFTTESR